MKKKVTKSTELVKQSDAELLAFVAAKLKGRILFPKRVASAKRALQNAIAAKP